MMKVLVATLALSFCATTLFGEGFPSLITIRGLNVDSSTEEIEDVFGQCKKDSEFEDSFLCYDEEKLDFSTSYRIDHNNVISHIHFHCKVINLCDYSVAQLAQFLSEGLNLSEPRLVVPGEPMWGLMMDGPSGDRLFVIKTDNLIVSISAHKYRE